MNLRVAITGASGFLGGALLRRLLADGCRVEALVRHPGGFRDGAARAYDLDGEPPDLAGFDAIVHAAFDMSGSGPEIEQRNVRAARRLLAAARRHRCRFVFISSMSAHANARSSYGRAKWAIERLLDPAIDTIVRPGLVVGPGGLYARMLITLCRAPVVPLFYGGTQPVQPIGIGDLVECLRLVVTRPVTGEINLGSATPLTIRELYAHMLAAAQRRRPLVPLPGSLALPLLRVAERLGLQLPLTAENLLGQKHLRAFDTADSFARLDFHPAPPAALPWAAPLSHP